ncbi:MAG: PH domain-containing protein [Fuerstiella sp.]
MVEHSSVAAGGFGQLLGSLYESLPGPFGLPRLSYIFALITAPLGLLLYAVQRLMGERYVLTNRSVQIWTARTGRMVASVGLLDFDHIELEQSPGQVFYNAADLRFVAADGKTLLRLKGIKDAASFRNAIQRTVDSRRMVQAAMSTIDARG